MIALHCFFFFLHQAKKTSPLCNIWKQNYSTGLQDIIWPCKWQHQTHTFTHIPLEFQGSELLLPLWINSQKTKCIQITNNLTGSTVQSMSIGGKKKKQISIIGLRLKLSMEMQRFWKLFEIVGVYTGPSLTTKWMMTGYMKCCQYKNINLMTIFLIVRMNSLTTDDAGKKAAGN